MNYDQAKDFLYNGDGSTSGELGSKFYNLYMAVTDDNIVEGLKLIKELTSCDDNTAKLLWVDLKCDAGTKENNPTLQARENYKKEKAFMPKCPTCGSTDLKPAGILDYIFTTSHGTNTHSFVCKNCGYEW